MTRTMFQRTDLPQADLLIRAAHVLDPAPISTSPVTS